MGFQINFSARKCFLEPFPVIEQTFCEINVNEINVFDGSGCHIAN